MDPRKPWYVPERTTQQITSDLITLSMLLVNNRHRLEVANAFCFHNSYRILGIFIFILLGDNYEDVRSSHNGT